MVLYSLERVRALVLCVALLALVGGAGGVGAAPAVVVGAHGRGDCRGETPRREEQENEEQVVHGDRTPLVA